jgi:phospholipid N-methyltransferase
MKDPAQVATICPSSRFLTDKIANRPCVRRATSLVELGPGEGGTTASLLSQMPADSRLLAIEKTKEFMPSLRAIEDPRLVAVCDDAAELPALLLRHEFAPPDVVVSGIPFSRIPRGVGRQIVHSIHSALCDGGHFIAYQVRGDVVELAEPWFGKAIESSLVAANLPPLRVHVWQKG